MTKRYALWQKIKNLSQLKNLKHIPYVGSTINDLKKEYRRLKAAQPAEDKYVKIHKKSRADWFHEAQQIAKQKDIDFKFDKYQPTSFYKKKYEEFSNIRKFSVTVEFKFEYRDTNDDQVRITQDWYPFTYTMNATSEDIPEDQLREAAMDYLDNDYLEDSAKDYVQDIEIAEINTLSIFPIDNTTSLADTSLYGSRLAYPNLKLKARETNLCAYEFLLKNYPSQAKNISHLEDFFHKDKKDGLTPKDLNRFAEYHNLSIYLVDLLNKAIISQTRNNNYKALMGVIANNHIYEIYERNRRKIDHAVRKTSTQYVGELMHERKNELKKKKCVLVDKIPETLENGLIYCLPNKHLTELYLDYLKQGLVYASKWKLERVTDIYLPDGVLSASFNGATVEQACKDFNIEFRNQSIPALARELWNDFISIKPEELIANLFTANTTEEREVLLSSKGSEGTLNGKEQKWKSSYFNKETKKLFNDNKSSIWIGAYYDLLVSTDEIKKCKGYVYGVDQCKQYTYVASEGDFFTVDVLDMPEWYCGEDITHGFYYIETDVRNACIRKNGFYDFKVIRQMLDDKIITRDNIKYVLGGTHQKENDKALKSFMEYTKEKSQLFKLINNTLIGSFGITASKKESKTIITASPREASYYFNSLGGDSTVTEILPGIYKIQGYTRQIQTSSDIPIRLQIVNRANLETYNLIKYTEKSKCIPIMVQTDCVLYIPKRNGPKVKTQSKPQPGDYREEKSKKCKVKDFIRMAEKFDKYTHRQRPDFQYDFTVNWGYEMTAKDDEDFDYNKILQFNRVYVQGSGGMGKSYCINRLRDILKDTFLYLAPTHTAANNISGQTIHSAFGINFNDNNVMFDKKIRQIISNYKGIIIDEISMIPLSIWRILNQLPETFKIYAFGDYRQLPPVEPGQDRAVYLDSNMIKLLLRNKITFTKQYRSDKAWANACEKYHDEIEKNLNGLRRISYFMFLKTHPILNNRIIKDFINTWDDGKVKYGSTPKKGIYKDVKSIDIEHDINIVKINDLRILINHFKMKAYRGEKRKVTFYEQEGYLYHGLPIISVENNKELDIFNNGIYQVKFFNDQKITIEPHKTIVSQYIPKNLEIDLTYEQFQKFNPFYAGTVHKLQGQTIVAPHTIWEFNRMCAKGRYTSLTRAKDSKLITIKNMRYIPLFKKKANDLRKNGWLKGE